MAVVCEHLSGSVDMMFQKSIWLSQIQPPCLHYTVVITYQVLTLVDDCFRHCNWDLIPIIVVYRFMVLR